jgi:hypothetical protein
LQLVDYTPDTAFKLLDMMIQTAPALFVPCDQAVIGKSVDLASAHPMPEGEPKGGGVIMVHHKMCV